MYRYRYVCVCVCIHISIYGFTRGGRCERRCERITITPRWRPATPTWPLHDIAITNIVWFTAYKRGVGKRAYIAQWPCNSIAIG